MLAATNGDLWLLTGENLVACCHPCNNRKGNRTPDEAGFKLQRAPRPFSLHTSRHSMRLLRDGADWSQVDPMCPPARGSII